MARAVPSCVGETLSSEDVGSQELDAMKPKRPTKALAGPV